MPLPFITAVQPRQSSAENDVRLARVKRELSRVPVGTPIATVVSLIHKLGGNPDGGAQHVFLAGYCSRYYIAPMIIVDIVSDDGRFVTGPVDVHRGGMSYD